MKTPNGIYIKHNDVLHTPEDWAKQTDPTIAKSVVIVTDICALEIAKNDLDGEFNFEDAQKAASEYGKGWRCPTQHEAIEMYDARFRGLDEAMKLIGGTTLDKNDWRWTCNADPDPECYSDLAYSCSGYTGYVGTYYKYNALSVRPVKPYKTK